MNEHLEQYPGFRAAGRAGRFRRLLLHAYRVGVFIFIVWLIHHQHQQYRAEQRAALDPQVSVDDARSLYPAAHALTGWDPAHGGQTVVDEGGRSLGYVVQTLPMAEHVVGYSGPTNTLIAFDTHDRVIGLKVLYCGDTPEHLADVVASQPFMTAFNGLTWAQAARHGDVDGVSGATLTSMSIVEGVTHRLGGAKPVSRFPDAITIGEARRFFQGADRLQERDEQPGVFDVRDERGVTIGVVTRTSPFTDDEIGYQGPTDTLIALDGLHLSSPDWGGEAGGRVKGLALRKSYDNEPYVGYVKGDEYFLNAFTGVQLQDLAKLDLANAGLDGVSGATKTSTAVLEALVRVARRLTQPPPAKPTRAFTLAPRDVGTAAVVLAALVIAFTPLRGVRWVRIGFQLVLVGYLGLINGDFVSQALVVGWAQSGVAWRLAPGLTLLTAAAIITPVMSRRQVYCSHVCPHGAVQDWLRRRLPWQVTLPRPLSHALRLMPAVLLAAVVLVAMRHWRFSLVGIEPFDAYVFRIAGWSAISIAVVGLVASLFVPMAYCRFGCPTGALLNFLRWHASGDRFSGRDAAALALVAIALAAWAW